MTTPTPTMHIIRRADGEHVYDDFVFMACAGPGDWTVPEELDHDEPTTYEILVCWPVARRTFDTGPAAPPQEERLFDVADVPLVDPLERLTVDELRDLCRAQGRMLVDLDREMAARKTTGGAAA